MSAEIADTYKPPAVARGRGGALTRLVDVDETPTQTLATRALPGAGAPEGCGLDRWPMGAF